MRHILLLILISTITKSISQTPILTIDSVPTQGVLLNTHWQYKMDHATDNRWKNIDPNREMLDSLPADIRKGIGTMRLYFMPSSKLKGKGYSMPIQQSIASEYYLNGNKLVSYGHLDTDPKKVVGQDPYWTPIHFPMKYDTINTLEIRFAFPKTKLYTTVFETENPVATLSLYESNQATTFYAKQISNYHVFEGLLIALCIMIMIIHFAFYYFNPEIKANLWFGLSRGIYLIGAILQMIFWFYTIDVSDKYWFGTMAMILFTLNNCTTFYAVLLYLQKKPDSWDKIGMALVIPTAVFVFMTQPWAWRIAPLFQVLIQVFTIRAAYLTLKKNKSDSILIMLGAVATILFFIKFISMGTYSSTSFFISLYPLRMFYYILYLLCLPIIFSILLSKEFSDTSKKLKLKLSEVQSLSDKNILIEQEKQQILQTQNLILEKEVTERTQDLIAKNHELEIEASLDKVRSRSLAMQHSDEIQEVAYTLYAELKKLNFPFGACSVYLIDQDDNMESWVAGFGDGEYPQRLKVPKFDHPVYNAYIEAFRKGKKYDVQFLSPALKPAYDDQMFLHTDYKKLNPEIIQFMRDLPSASFSLAYNKYGALHWGPAVLSEVQANILQKFSSVFEQSYTRFLDLQKAEAQAKEAQIEATLERIRGRALSMNTSDELNTLIGFTYSECLKLNMHLDRGFIMTFDSVTNDANWWMVGSESPDKPSKLLVKYHEHAPNLAILDGWHSREQKWSYFLGGENKKNWDDYTLVKTDLALLPDFVIQDMRSVENIILNASFQNFGCIMLSSFEPMSDEHFDLLVRISKVFDFTYTRFLDLKSKEEQLREAQIETALEKIRSRSLAMHKSDELHEVMKVLFEKMTELNVIKGTLALQLFDEEKNSSDFWVSNEIQHISKVSLPYRKDILESNGYMKDCWKAYHSKVDIINKMYPRDQKDRYFDYVFASNDTATIPTHVREFINNNPDQIQCLLVEKHSCIFVDNWEAQPFEEDQIKILKRVAKVFDQSYIRFLDLQKAEEQTREAQIEASLERIRAATLAMQSTDQLSSVILFIYGELNKIESELNRCFFMVFDPQNFGVTWWMAGVDTPDLGKGFFVPYSEHAPQMAYLRGWQEKKERWQYRMQGDEKRKWDNYLFHHTDLARLPDVIKDNMQAFTDIYLDGSFNSFGCLTTGSPVPLSTKAVDLLVRYSKVFDLSFTRYNDLKQAEAQARESQIETALEKIRSSSLAMQKSHEIKSVVTTLFQKLKELKVDFNGAAAIHIFNDTTKDAVIWVATPTLEFTIEVQLPYDADYFIDNPIITDIWHAKETGQDIITKIYPLQEKNRYFQYVFKHNPQIPDFEQKRIYNELNYSATFIAQPNSLLGVNSWSDNQLITDEQYKLLKRVGYVFEQAYVRFLDLQKAEALAEQARLDLIQIQTEKKRAEDALKELSATQAQLIQSEKMASLGELTAGIAHEIQNPLNFVNNFSEINNDLINELKEEFEKGNKQQATEIINDIKINSEKIHHHGHRASSIVKNMLEHSRKSSGVKSLTDINALCNEFLRLAYHGLRGKDKTFNSDFSIDPDLSLPKINVISQDISRVILNLVTNAFYAVCEKSKQINIRDYKPEVTIKTRKLHEEIEIHINDNGPGIPDSIKDKIFQPFFTTKPTGQGTGLGLSLSYDIVKAHGGTIKVASPEGHGSSFVITLPIA